MSMIVGAKGSISSFKKTLRVDIGAEAWRVG